MPWQQNIQYLIGKPVGVSLMNGQGVTGVLCNAYNGEIYLMEYLYHSQFAMKHYSYQMIQDIHPFPNCNM